MLDLKYYGIERVKIAKLMWIISFGIIDFLFGNHIKIVIQKKMFLILNFNKMIYELTRDVKLPERANPTDSWIDFFIPNDLDIF